MKREVLINELTTDAMIVLSQIAATIPRNPTMITPNPTAMRNADPTKFLPSDNVANSLFAV